MLGKLLIICVAFTAIFAESFAPAPETRLNIGRQINGSELVDNVMGRVRAELIRMKLDNITPPDLQFRLFNQSVAIKNQSYVGLANVQRVGDVYVNVTLLNTKIRSAFAIYNVSGDSDVEIVSNQGNYSNGHIHTSCDNITVCQVFLLNHATQTLSLDEFELSIGECNHNVTGLGERAENTSSTITQIFKKTKTPLLWFFNITFKLVVNLALQAARAALVG